MLGLAVWAAASPAHATHSLPADPKYWDVDNDGVADQADGDRYYLRVGTGWDATKEGSVGAGASAWAVSTTWDPTFTTSVFSVATIRVDGQFPSTACSPGAWQAGDVAGNCVRAEWKDNSYWDIFDSDIGIDPTPGGSGQTWEWAQVVPSATEWSLRGVMTHEVGHGAFLKDLYGASDCDSTPLTMCGAGEPGPFTWDLRTLATDDINAANAID